MKKSILCSLLALLIFTQGCCSIFTSDPQTVSVGSEPPGADVTIGPHEGVTPYSIRLPRGKNYVIEASYEGETKSKVLERKIEGVYWINILFWPGLIIDLATGAMYEYDPTHYSFNFTQ